MKHSIFQIALVCAAVLVTSCNQKPSIPPDPKTIVGVYRGQYYGGTETFKLHEDGTSTQEFTKDGSGVVYSLKGKWELSGHDVSIRPFYVARTVAPSNSEPALMVGVGQGTFFEKPERIEFGEWPYLVTKLR
ncbi:MAG: hypothetical protein U1F83_01770 [Verrucomicrobiota bacterium]